MTDQEAITELAEMILLRCGHTPGRWLSATEANAVDLARLLLDRPDPMWGNVKTKLGVTDDHHPKH